MTDEFRVVKSFLEMLKVELVRKEDNWKTAIRFTNMRPGYEQNAITLELDSLPEPIEMLQVACCLLVRPPETENPQDERP